jgi:hypothetical protein
MDEHSGGPVDEHSGALPRVSPAAAGPEGPTRLSQGNHLRICGRIRSFRHEPRVGRGFTGPPITRDGYSSYLGNLGPV